MSNLHHFYRINILSVLLCMLIIMIFRDKSLIISRHYCQNSIEIHFCFLSNLMVKSGKNYQIVLVHLNKETI